ncbi:MAG: MerR family transcriptional regulator [Bacteroidales bacterium]
MEGLNLYSIKDLENFSGIKAHTIRIWEKRYNILIPDRTDTNIRTYSENELKKILNVAYLNRNGLKISRIAVLEEDELTSRVMEVSSRHDEKDQTFQPGKILMAALKFSEEQFREALGPYISRNGIEAAYTRYLNPLLVKAAILWQTGSLSRAQEQFVRNTIRQLLVIEESKLRPVIYSSDKCVAMINTSDSFNDCNFLFYKYALKRRGYDVIFTGGLLPPSEVLEIHKVKPFTFLLVNCGTFDFANRKIEYFTKISRSLNLRKVVFCDYPGSSGARKNERILITKDPADFLAKCEIMK